MIAMERMVTMCWLAAVSAVKPMGSNPFIATNRATSALLLSPDNRPFRQMVGRKHVTPMVTTKTTALVTSATLSNGSNLDLNVTDEAEFKKLYEGFRKSVAAVGSGFKSEANQVATRKREALYKDLAAALAVCEVLLDPANVDYLIEALELHGIPAVVDPAKGNEYVPLCRLMWGYWPQATTANPDPAFIWDRSPELYGKVLRGAVVRGIKPSELAAKLLEEKGFKKFKEADDNRYLKDDQDEKDKVQRFKDVINDDPKAVIPAEGFGIPAKDRPSLVAVLCAVSADGKELNALQRLPISVQSLEQHVHKMAPDLVADIRVRQAEKRAAAAEAALAAQMAKVTVDALNGLSAQSGDSHEAAS